MAEGKRDEAQRRRAEGRRRRREQDDGEPERAAETPQDDSKPEEPLEAVKHAAKVAAAAAAVGAAVGAARAITSNGNEDDEPAEAEHPEPAEEREPEPEPVAEHEQPSERQEEPQERPAAQGREDDGTRPEGASPDEARRVVASAREALAALVGKDADSISGLDRNGDGWLVTLEVVELERIPSSTDVLASYEVELDRDRKLVRYQRGRRYFRSQAGDGDQA